MALKFTGEIVHIGETKNVGKKKPMFKRVFVVDDSEDDRYQNPVPFELTRGNVELVNGMVVGERVEVDFYANGRVWNNPKTGENVYFCSLNAVKVERIGESANKKDSEGDLPDESCAEDHPMEDLNELPF